MLRAVGPGSTASSTTYVPCLAPRIDAIVAGTATPILFPSYRPLYCPLEPADPGTPFG
jgi:hypothetical protein